MRLTIGAPQLGQSGEAAVAAAGFGVELVVAGVVFCTSRIIASSAPP